MIEGKRVIAVVTARKNSKRIPGKNNLKLNGKSLVQIALDHALESEFIDYVILSSDDNELQKYCAHHERIIWDLRPGELAQDTTSSAEVLEYVIRNYDENDIFVLLQPTSPLRRSYDIDECIKKALQSKSKTCLSVCQTEVPLQWCFTSLDGSISEMPLVNEGARRSQDYAKSFRINGAVFVFSKQIIIGKSAVVDQNTLYYEMPRELSVDIDTYEDYALLQYYNMNLNA
jgi:CMP-N,N'-diacetyllegionaminic acid synthase